MSESTPHAYAYYPGCSQMGTCTEYEMSTRACCEHLGIELVEVRDWSCCGSTPAHTVDHSLAAALAARNLETVADMGHKEVVTPCPSCLTLLKTADQRMGEDPAFRQKVNGLLDKPFEGRVASKSVIQVLLEDVGLDKIKELTTKPLQGVALAPYYGCLQSRPPELMTFDDPENPTSMDRMMEAVGAEVVPFPFKVDCCGAAQGVPKRDSVMRMSGRILEMAHECGANAVVVLCPLCHMNLDMRQAQINAASGSTVEMPVLYFTQLLGLALGIEAKKLGLDKHYVSPTALLAAMTDKAAEVAAAAAAS